MINRRILAIVGAVGLAGLTLAPAEALQARSAEQDAVYRGVNSGRMLSLSQVRAIASRKVSGEYLGVEMDDTNAREGLYVYRLTYRRPDGAIVRVDVDAQNGRILGIYGN